MLDNLEEIVKWITAISVILGAVYGAFRWFQTQNKHTDDIKELKALHKSDMEEAQKKENEDMQEIKDELCVLSYAMLAVFDGLQQLHCNGNVTKARDSLEKHLNQRAHDQV